MRSFSWDLFHGTGSLQPHKLPGKALHVAIALYFIGGIKRQRTVTLSGTILDDLGIKRHAAYRGLSKLKDAGLILVEEKPKGHRPSITILEIGQKGGHQTLE